MVPPRDVFGLGLKRKPVLLVDMDADDHRITSVIIPSGKNKWGSLPMPSF